MGPELERLAGRGRVFCSEIATLLPAGYEFGPKLDDILAMLERAGVEVLAEPDLEPVEDQSSDDPSYDDPVQVYVSEMCKLPLLSRDEEAALIAQWTEEAKVRLIEANLRMVVSVSRCYADRGVHVLDLVIEGNNGLSNAVNTFQPGRGFRFSTYAAWCARLAILRKAAAAV